ncbi:MAG: HlyD family efflux transporter periplasmic adaptor subunit [Phycisphaerales bacterium]|nr:MAG: HlyD family efflux transporter periplasmic adaptor subunit [Phycisphaerales bacterium]
MPSQKTKARRPTARAFAWVTILIVLALLAAAAIAFLVFRPGKAASTSATDSVAPAMDSFDIVTTAVGELDSRNKVEVRNPLERGAQIMSIVAEGTRVKAGDLLIQLATDEIQREIDTAKEQVESAKADLVDAESEYEIQVNDNESSDRKAQLEIELAQLALNQWLEGEVSVKRQQNTLAINRASIEVDRLADKFSRSQLLLDEGFVSKDEVDRDEVEYIEAISNFKTSNLQALVFEQYEYPRELKTKQSAVDNAIDELERVRLRNTSQLTNREATRKNRTEQLRLRQERLAKAQQQFDAATIRAPREGLVVFQTSLNSNNRWGQSEGPLQVGQQVAPNELLIILPDTSDMIAAIRVPEAVSGRIRQGMPARVRIDALAGRQFSGTVESIGVLAETGGWRDPNRRDYTVKIALDTADQGQQLKPSMRAEANIILGSVENALTIPVQAIFQEGAVRFVYLRKGVKFARQPIKLGRRSDTHAEILAGLSTSDAVLIREPGPEDILKESWKTAQLELAGYTLGEDGTPKSAGGPGTNGDRPQGRRRPPGQTPAGQSPAGQPPVESSPASTPAAATPSPSATTPPAK